MWTASAHHATLVHEDGYWTTRTEDLTARGAWRGLDHTIRQITRKIVSVEHYFFDPQPIGAVGIFSCLGPHHHGVPSGVPERGGPL